MKKAIMFIEDGFEDIECLGVRDILIRADINVDLCSIKSQKEVISKCSLKIKPDISFSEVLKNNYDIIILPGGPWVIDFVRDDKLLNLLVEFLKKENKNNKLIAAICAAPLILGYANLLKENLYTCYPKIENLIKLKPKNERVVKNKNIITGNGPLSFKEFAFEIVKTVLDNNVVEKLKKEMVN